jgi:hypothetical protein
VSRLAIHTPASRLGRRPAFLVGAIAGGVALGAGLMVIAGAVQAVGGALVLSVLVLLSTIAFLGALPIAGLKPLGYLLPHRYSQVTLAGSEPAAIAFRWGIELGLGFWTHVGTPLLYVIFLPALFVLPPWMVLGVAVLYATTRAAAILAVAYLRRDVGHHRVQPSQVLHAGRIVANFVAVPVAIAYLWAAWAPQLFK